MNQPDIWNLVIKEMEERRLVGLERYGRPVLPFNGRNPALDLEEELLDAIVYHKQQRIELEQLGRDLHDLQELSTHPETTPFALREVIRVINTRYAHLLQPKKDV